MTEKEALTKALEQIGWSQEMLANAVGYKTQSAVANRLNNKNAMRTDVLVKLLKVMGYEVVIRSKSSKNKEEWVISYGEGDSE